jgi:hypothetical protein
VPIDPVRRARDICLSPRATFLEIDREKAGIGEIFRDYVAWFVALEPLARASAAIILDGATGLARVAPRLAVGYVLTLACVYLVALAANLVAPLFGGERDEDQAVRLVAFSLTPGWIGGALAPAPFLGLVGLALSLFTLVLVWIGAPRLLNLPEERAPVFALAVGVLMAGAAYGVDAATGGLR